MDSKKNIWFLTGASGTGKSTILNYIEKNFNLQTKEISARPFLPTTGSYDKTLTDEIQSIIVLNRTLSVLEYCLEFNNTLKPVIFSRSAIDNLAYQRVLGKAPFLDKMCKKEVELTAKYCNIIYTPIEFSLQGKGEADIVRGMNDKVRQETDKEIKNILKEFNVPHYTLSGSIKDRELFMDKVFSQFKKFS